MEVLRRIKPSSTNKFIQLSFFTPVSSEECLNGLIEDTLQEDIRQYLERIVSGASSDRVTPDPIPNSAVKPVSADGSLRARVGQCREQSSSNTLRMQPAQGCFLFFQNAIIPKHYLFLCRAYFTG